VFIQILAPIAPIEYCAFHSILDIFPFFKFRLYFWNFDAVTMEKWHICSIFIQSKKAFSHKQRNFKALIYLLIRILKLLKYLTTFKRATYAVHYNLIDCLSFSLCDVHKPHYSFFNGRTSGKRIRNQYCSVVGQGVKFFIGYCSIEVIFCTVKMTWNSDISLLKLVVEYLSVRLFGSVVVTTGHANKLANLTIC